MMIVQEWKEDGRFFFRRNASGVYHLVDDETARRAVRAKLKEKRLRTTPILQPYSPSSPTVTDSAPVTPNTDNGNSEVEIPSQLCVVGNYPLLIPNLHKPSVACFPVSLPNSRVPVPGAPLGFTVRARDDELLDFDPSAPMDEQYWAWRLGLE
jgi:hypothetical protein